MTSSIKIETDFPSTRSRHRASANLDTPEILELVVDRFNREFGGLTAGLGSQGFEPRL
jgi:hypothetical protein